MKCFTLTVLLISALYLDENSIFSFFVHAEDVTDSSVTVSEELGSGVLENDDGARIDFDQESDNVTTTEVPPAAPALGVENLDFVFPEVEDPARNETLIDIDIDNSTITSTNGRINTSDYETPPARGRSDDEDSFFDDYEATNSRNEISQLGDSDINPEPGVDAIGTGIPGRDGGSRNGKSYNDYYDESDASDQNQKPNDTTTTGSPTAEGDTSKKSRIEFVYGWDQLGLLIFIILCIILLTILIFCCYIVRHMYDWAIIKVVKTSHDDLAVKYTVGPSDDRNPREKVQLLSICNQFPEPRVMDAMMLEKEFGFGSATREIHKTTAHVELRPIEDKFAPVTVLVRPTTGNKPENVEAALKQEWMADIFKTMENEPESENNFNELKNLKQQRLSSNMETRTRKKNLNHIDGSHSQSLENIIQETSANQNQEGLTFLERFGVTNSSSRTNVRTTTVETTNTVVSASSTNAQLVVTGPEVITSGQRSASRSRDDLGDEDMADYLEGYKGYPV